MHTINYKIKKFSDCCKYCGYKIPRMDMKLCYLNVTSHNKRSINLYSNFSLCSASVFCKDEKKSSL